MGRLERLQKYLARAGVASRRHCESLISSGRVVVDGAVVTSPGWKVDPESVKIAVDGVVVRPPDSLTWLALHKPRGFVTTRNDPKARTIVAELVPPMYRSLYPIGRLDKDTSGLILMTNDGETAHRLMHPRYEVSRVYVAGVTPMPDRHALLRLSDGIRDADELLKADEVTANALSTGAGLLTVRLHEGKNREIRRMMKAIGVTLTSLVRISYGPIGLGALKVGKWRLLSDSEVRALRSVVGLE